MLSAFSPLLYVKVAPERLTVRSFRTGAEIAEVPEIAIGKAGKTAVILGVGAEARIAASTQSAELVNPFNHPRTLLGDFTVGEQLLKAFVRRLNGNSWFVRAPRIVMHTLGTDAPCASDPAVTMDAPPRRGLTKPSPMPTNASQLIGALLALVILTFIVGARLLFTRVQESRQKRIHPQAVATSVKMAARFENVQAADNFRNLFEVPVLFYALVAVALATHQTPGWLVVGAWAYVGLRVVHSFIHCTYNTVMHRLAAFLGSFMLLVALWVAFFFSLPGAGAA